MTLVVMTLFLATVVVCPGCLLSWLSSSCSSFSFVCLFLVMGIFHEHYSVGISVYDWEKQSERKEKGSSREDLKEMTEIA